MRWLLSRRRNRFDKLAPVIDERVALANTLADIADDHGIEMRSCCGDYLIDGKIRKAHCVDASILQRRFMDKVGRLAAHPTRKECGCFECTDIGAYDTCPHGCVYCYANSKAQTALRSYERHDNRSDMLGRNTSIHDMKSKAVGGGELKLDL